jgi:hypothetical protein
MWILPPSITSAFAQDTGESISASPEQWAEACERSLIARSKPSPARTWLQRWKRDSWTRHLSGLISNPSLGKSFVDWWTSSLEATRASRSVPQASEPARTTRDTFGHGSQMELPFADPDSVSSRTLKDTFRWDSPQSSATWKKWVTERRGAYSQRLKSALHTNGSGSLSWPTVQACEARANRYRNGLVKGTQKWLTTVALSYGLPAQRNLSTDGSHPELLNPRWVETLMGVPIGWTMPSCTSPVTIAPTNSDSSETESCQPQQSELF